MIRRAIEALIDALGPIETARFLSLPRDRYPDYVAWHQQWQEDLEPEDFFDAVFDPPHDE
jgi:hypothetical protein